MRQNGYDKDQEEIDKAESMTYVVEPSEMPGVWLAHCLELDVVGQSRFGGGPEGAVESAIEMAKVLLEETRFQTVQRKRAPDEYWPPDALARIKEPEMT